MDTAVTRKQTLVMRELTLWYAVLLTAQSVEPWTRGGLCSLLSNDFGLSDLPSRARNNRPSNTLNQYVFWWPSYTWTPRIKFIRKMIRLCEQELAQ